jgi:acetyltransferase
MRNLAESFTGTLVAVNPKTSKLFGKPCYPSLSAVPHAIDMVVIVVPGPAVPTVLTEAGEKGVRAAVVISAGFKESGRLDLETELIAIAKRYRIALVGPNCLGIIVPSQHMNASFAVGMPQAGNVAFLSQSGALCAAVLDYAAAHRIGFSAFVSMGNKAVLDETVMLDYLARDPKTDVVAMYIESLADGEAFIRAARKITRTEKPKPIFVLKSGKTSAGASAASSHTGALAGDDAIYNAIFAQAGVVRTARVAEFFDCITVASRNPLPSGVRTAIITNAGGIGVLTTDELVTNHLELARLDDLAASDLAAKLPAAASVKNPIDILGDARADRYGFAIDAAVESPDIDNIIVLLTPQSMTEPLQTAERIVNAKKLCDKPIVATFMGASSVEAGVQFLESNQVATTAFPMQAARALGLFAAYRRFAAARTIDERDDASPRITTQTIETANAIIDQALQDGRKHLLEPEALRLLETFGLKLPSWRFVKHRDEAIAAVSALGVPCVFKIVSPDILHKSDVGGVRLDVTPENASNEYVALLRSVAKYAPDARIEGVLTVAQAGADNVEMIVGGRRDPLGTLLMTGLGGIFVEVFKDVAFGLAPVNRTEIDAMLQSLKGHPLLEGARGQAERDTDALIDIIKTIEKVFSHCPKVAECDLNPVAVFAKGNGVSILDGRIVLSSQ